MQRIAAMCADLSFVLVDREGRIALVVGGPLADRELADQLPALEPGARVEWEAEGAVYRVDALPFDAVHTLLTVRDISNGRALQRSLEVERTFLSAVLSQLGERVRVADADGRLLNFDGADGRRRPAPARVGGALRPAPPRRPDLRPARDAAAARAARGGRARGRGPCGRRRGPPDAARERRPGARPGRHAPGRGDRHRRPHRLPRRRGPPAALGGAPPARRRERQRLRLRDRRPGPLDVPLRGVGGRDRLRGRGLPRPDRAGSSCTPTTAPTTPAPSRR